MSSEKRDFDKAAASWDEQPRRIKLAEDVANSILKEITLTSDMDVLDFGCGTGLLTLQLQPLVNSITGADTSQGMINVLKEKIKNQNLVNVKTLHLDSDEGNAINGNYNLIISLMTFHHIKEIRPVLDQFYEILFPSGYLCIADLDSDNGQFHDNHDGVFHSGFDRSELTKVFKEAGFDDVRSITAAEVIKPGSEGVMRKFTVFLMICRKRLH